MTTDPRALTPKNISRSHVTLTLPTVPNPNPNPSDPIQYAPNVDTEYVFIRVIFSGISGHGMILVME